MSKVDKAFFSVIVLLFTGMITIMIAGISIMVRDSQATTSKPYIVSVWVGRVYGKYGCERVTDTRAIDCVDMLSGKPTSIVVFGGGVVEVTKQ